MGLVVGLGIVLDGKLDGVVDLGGQHLIGAVALRQSIVNGLVLGLVLLRRGIHAVQTLAVPGEKPQGDLGADFLQGGFVHRAGHRTGGLVGLAGIQGRAVRGVGPDGPDHAGGGQRDAGGIVDLAAGGLDRAVQQLLLGGVLAIGGAVLDLDLVQAVDDHKGCQRHQRHSRAETEMPQLCAQPGMGVRTAQAVRLFFGLGG